MSAQIVFLETVRHERKREPERDPLALWPLLPALAWQTWLNMAAAQHELAAATLRHLAGRGGCNG